jgi:SanA protein
MKILKKLLWLGLVFVTLILILTIIANININSSTSIYIKDNPEDLPTCKVGLLLGTSKFLRAGVPNEYFDNRIKAAVELYKSGKIKYILVSGDNGKKYYNEPLDMKKELLKYGIPDSVIYLDNAGFRTFDSIIRAKEVFGQTSYIVISQNFHNKRAVYIARHYNIEAYGYDAKDVSAYNGFRTKVREFFARAKVFIDIFIGKEPKYLGEKITIGE